MADGKFKYSPGNKDFGTDASDFPHCVPTDTSKECFDPSSNGYTGTSGGSPFNIGDQENSLACGTTTNVSRIRILNAVSYKRPFSCQFVGEITF